VVKRKQEQEKSAGGKKDEGAKTEEGAGRNEVGRNERVRGKKKENIEGLKRNCRRERNE